MQSIITRYLLQSSECALTHIGTFAVNSKPAELDIVHKQMLPPSGDIIFADGDPEPSSGLINYIAQKKGFSYDVAETILNQFCTEWRERLDTGEQFVLPSLGSLQRDEKGKIFFRREKPLFELKPVAAERVLHQNAEHTILVGDTHVSSVLKVEDILDEPALPRSKWWVWAACLALVGIGTLIYYFSTHPFNASSIGNQSHFLVDSLTAIHHDFTAE